MHNKLKCQPNDYYRIKWIWKSKYQGWIQPPRWSGGTVGQHINIHDGKK